MIVNLVGPHGAGKTTFGKALAAVTGWTFHDEIGKRLAADSAFRSSGARTSDPQPRFDLEVFAREVERDRTFAEEHPGAIRIVETWHPGNIAFAMSRSPSVVGGMIPHVRHAIDWSRVVVVPVGARRATLEQRKEYPEPLSYFLAVGLHALTIALAYGAIAARPICTDHGTPEDLVAGFLPHIEGLARHVRSRRPFARPRALA